MCVPVHEWKRDGFWAWVSKWGCWMVSKWKVVRMNGWIIRQVEKRWLGGWGS